MIITKRTGEWLQIIIPSEWAGITITDLFREVWQAPKKLTHQFRSENKVLLEGNRGNWNTPLPSGAKIQLHLFEEEASQVIPSYHEINILFEDEHVLIINKPPFMNTHPNDPYKETDTLMNAAAFYLLSKGESANVRQVHRLDRDTSGAILFAKHALAGAILDQMLEKRSIKRTYIAAVHGLLKQRKGTLNLPIGRDRHHATRRRVSPTGQDAVTHYQVLEYNKQKELTYIKCWLETGRTHQIRVHFSHYGHPLIGDILYGGQLLTNRQALHAAKLEFSHPFTKETILCYAPFTDLPEIFNSMDVYKM
ncbi:RluA family pseudouridine synthase [Bacillus sp. ISL-18]|uniref:RluA family pseudouridine synthase n=1 Tax=Bacillus sp. ISL-18 TaxID=2819118 RepID=UPI001BE78E8B|nr:RluA family pseudouridine synthase [Bacillus sp. ISL-18]MBT2653715.1 RluA family pseudouridine synthase [Bacillus sp. ISL-18]